MNMNEPKTLQILLTLAYDGTAYCGWQRQLNGISVQQRLEEALSALFDRPVAVKGASRTDAGVHAKGQRASFFLSELKIPIDKLPMVINSKLPADIAVNGAELVPVDFHPRFGAKVKTYCYAVWNDAYPLPQKRNYAWFVPARLNVADMAEGAKAVCGTHDFTAFCAAGGSAKTMVRTVYELEVSQAGPEIEIRVTGNGFLYNMVRIIAGTLVYVGQGKIKAEDVARIIDSRDRVAAGKTAPPQGLCLETICYDAPERGHT